MSDTNCCQSMLLRRDLFASLEKNTSPAVITIKSQLKKCSVSRPQPTAKVLGHTSKRHHYNREPSSPLIMLQTGNDDFITTSNNIGGRERTDKFPDRYCKSGKVRQDFCRRLWCGVFSQDCS